MRTKLEMGGKYVDSAMISDRIRGLFCNFRSMEKSVSWAFGWVSVSERPKKVQLVESNQERWVFLTQGETRRWYEKAVNGHADDHSSLYIQNILDKNKHLTSNILGYFDFQFDRVRMEEEFQKYIAVCSFLAQPQHRDDIIKQLLSPDLRRVVITWRFLNEEALQDARDLLSVDFPPKERLFSLLNFLHQMDVIGERGEPVSIVQMNFEYDNVKKNFQIGPE